MCDLTPRVCRAARAALDWTQGELAERAGCHTCLVTDFERGGHKPKPRNLLALKQAFEAAGVRFITPCILVLPVETQSNWVEPPGSEELNRLIAN